MTEEKADQNPDESGADASEAPGGPGVAAAGTQSSGSSQSSSPGQILREGRRRHDYTVEDLCEQTKLNIDTVHALENDDWQSLPSSVFVKGYYRQCGKVLDLDIDRILEAYNTNAGPEQAAPLKTTPSGNISGEVISRGRRAGRQGGCLRGSAIVLVIVGIAVLAAGVWLISGSDSNDTGGQPPGDAGQGEIELESNENDEPEPESSEEAAEPSEDSADRQETDADDDSEDEALDGDQQGQNVNDMMAGESSLADEEEGASDEKPDSDDDEKPDRLVMKFEDESWVSVTDAAGEQLLSGTFNAGDEQELDGKPPYQLVIGYTDGVKATIGGQPVDIKSHAGNGKTARLKVESASSD